MNNNTINITNYKNKPIKIFSTIKGNSQLAVIYPGMGYGLNAPVFFYLLELLSKSFDMIALDYRYNENEDFLNAADDIKDTWLDFDAKQIGAEIEKLSRNYQRVIYIGKLLGTTMLMKQIQMNLIRPQSELIWLTPGTYVHDIYTTLLDINNRSLLLYGTADKFYSKTEADRIQHKKNIRTIEFDNAGHVFEVEGNIKASINNIAKVIDSIEKFIKSS